MASTLFSMMFSAMLMDAFQDSDTGFPIRYRFDDNIFNLRRLQAKTKAPTDVLDGPREYHLAVHLALCSLFVESKLAL